MDAAQKLPGSNQGRTRGYNRALVLSHVRAAGASGRAEIARASGLTTQTVSNIIADLEADGLLSECGRRSGSRGLPAVQYALRPDGGFALGIEVRPDALRAALLDLSGQALFTERLGLTRADPATVAAAVVRMRDLAIQQTGVPRDRLLGAGVVMPGPFGATGLADSTTDLPGWRGTDAAAFLEAALGLPVHVENDANAAAIAERHAGVARGLATYAFLYFGAGLGLGIVADGRLIRGAFGNAGEIGHMPWGAGQLEDVASRMALARRMAAAGQPATTVEDIAHLDGHPDLARWLDDAAPALAGAITLIENLLDPETVILGGALPDAVIDALIERIALSDASVAHRPDRRTPRLQRGASGRMTATLGAAAHVLDHAFTPRLAAT
jgi:predicted NBD/HSP70 family sugar kinase